MDDFTLKLSTATEYYYTPLKDLFYIESLGNDVNIYTRFGKKIFRETLTHIQELIDKEGLFKLHGCARVGRSHIINFNNVSFIDLNKFQETENNTKKTYYGKILFEHCGKKISISLNREEVKLVKALMEQLGRNPYLRLSNNTYELTVPVSKLNEDAKGEQFIDLGLPSGTKWSIGNLEISSVYLSIYDEDEYDLYDDDSLNIDDYLDDLDDSKDKDSSPIDMTEDSNDNSFFDRIPDANMDDDYTEIGNINHFPHAVDEKYQDHVSWGELKAKNYFDENNYYFEWGLGNNENEDLYGFQYEDDYEYFQWKDCNNQLPSLFDIAVKALESPCHIPTADDWKELVDNCTFIWCKSCINTYGLLATSKINCRCIFLPASGFRYKKNLFKEGQMLAYWTSTYDSPYQSKAFTYNNRKENGTPKILSMDGFLGLSIRPVQGGHLAPNPTLREEFEINETIFRIEDPDNKTCSLYFYFGPSSKIVIPEKVEYNDETYTVTTIRENAFLGLPVNMYIPATIKKLPKMIDTEYPFMAFGTFKVANDNPSFSSENGALFDKNKTTLLSRPNTYNNVYKVPDGVTRIAENAFFVSRIELVDTNQVTDIGPHAFQSSSVKRIQGHCVKVLEKECFNDCDSLETIDFPNVVEVKQCAFSGCDKLKHIIFPKLKKCEYGAFNNCGAESMTFHSQIEKIYSNLFRDCNYLEKIEFKIIPKKVCPDPFCNCEKLKTIIVGGKSYTREEFNQTFCP